MAAPVQISIILPVKHEEKNIRQTLKSIHNNVKYTHEVLVIYDDERDLTLSVITALQPKYTTVKLHKNRFHTGVLNAIKTGFAKAQADTVVVMAADGTDDPATINVMYEKILAGFDLICPSRYSKGGEIIGKLTMKALLSRAAGFCTPLLLGIPTSDLTYSFKMIRKHVLKSVRIQSRGGFEFSEELVIKSNLNGYKITEVPTVWKDRTLGKSKFELLHWLPSYIYWFIWGIYKNITKFHQTKTH